jgi:hypothetical protein
VPTTGAAFEHLATLSAAGADVLALAWTPDGGTLVAGTDTGLVLWRSSADAIASSACTATGDPVTAAEWQLYLPGRAYDPPCPRPPS